MGYRARPVGTVYKVEKTGPSALTIIGVVFAVMVVISMIAGE